MTPEEKLKHLENYMHRWIDWRVNSTLWIHQTIKMALEMNILIVDEKDNSRFPSFKQYLKRFNKDQKQEDLRRYPLTIEMMYSAETPPLKKPLF